jgi:hypothetical protein
MLPDPLPNSDMEEIMDLVTNGEPLSRGDFVIAIYLRNLLVDCRAGRETGPKYLPSYLPEWLKAVGASLNSGHDAEAALRAGKDVVAQLGPPKHHESSSMSSPPITGRPQNGRPSLRNPDNERRTRYSAHSRKATPDDPPPRYSSVFGRQTLRHGPFRG